MTPKGRRGFTLVELIVTMGVVTLIVAASTASFRSIGTVRKASLARAEMEHQVRRSLMRMTESLHNMVRTTDPNEGPAFLGGPDESGEEMRDRIDFFVFDQTPLRDGQPEADIYEASFFLLRRADAEQMVLLERRDAPLDDDPIDGGVVTVVAENIVGLGFNYFDGIEWFEEWTEARESTPRAVRVTVLATEDVRWVSPGKTARTLSRTAIVALDPLVEVQTTEREARNAG